MGRVEYLERRVTEGLGAVQAFWPPCSNEPLASVLKVPAAEKCA